jgi:peptidyl-prolyl cis-trans isomerase D
MHRGFRTVTPMFEFFRTHTRFLLALLVLLIIPSFVFLGMDGYTRMSDGANRTVATIQSQKVTQAEWDEAHRNQVERIRRQMPNVDAAMFDQPQMRRQTLDALVRDRVMLTAADKLHLVTTDDRLQRLFVSDPQFAFLRNPDGSVNREVLASQGMSSEMFAQRLRQDFTMRQVMAGIGGSAFATDAVAAKSFDALLQQREVQVQRLPASDFTAKVTPTDAEIEAYYNDPVNAERYRAPEQASVEYLVLDQAAIEKTINVPEEDLRKYYTENAARWGTPEERRASHILVKTEAGAPEADKAKAREKAQAILARVKAKPDSFADEARANSDDPGSKGNGGDLDYFARDAMVKPFADAAFGMKQGDISDLVQTEFGWHIIRVTGVRGGEKKSFDAVRAEVLAEVRKQLATKRYAELAGDFTNIVYEQPDSLKPAAEKFGLTIQTAPVVTRTPAPGASGPLSNAKFIEALFSSETMRNKRNTEAVEIAANQLVSGRVVQYQPARVLPLAEVKDAVRASLVARGAAAQAKAAGEARLAELRKTPDTAVGSTLVISRAQPRDLPPQVLDAALKEPADKLPALVGVDLGNQGFAVVKVTKVLGRDPIASDAGQVRTQYAQAWSNAEADAYYAALKRRFDVKFTPAATAADTAASAPR